MTRRMQISNNQRNRNSPLAGRGRFLAFFFLLVLGTASPAQVFRESLEQVLVEGQWLNAFRSQHDYVNGRRMKVTSSRWLLEEWKPFYVITYSYDYAGRLLTYLVEGSDTYYKEYYQYNFKGALIEMSCDPTGSRVSGPGVGGFQAPTRKFWNTISYRCDDNGHILASTSANFPANGDYCYKTNGRMMLVTCIETYPYLTEDSEYSWIYITSQNPPGLARKYNLDSPWDYVSPDNSQSHSHFHFNGNGYPLQYFTDPQETPGNPMLHFPIARYTVRKRQREGAPSYRGYDGWIDKLRFTFSYDSSSVRLRSDIKERYRIFNYPHEGAWQLQDKNEYHYDAEGRCAEVLYSIWQDSTGWLPSRRITFSYDQTVPSRQNAQADYRIQNNLKLANYPNPFNSETRIHFERPASSEICVSTFDLDGREIKCLLDQSVLTAGVHEITWNGTDSNGRPVPSGVYFLQLRLNNAVAQTKRCLLIK